jgi:hypothetical protein
MHRQAWQEMAGGAFILASVMAGFSSSAASRRKRLARQRMMSKRVAYRPVVLRSASYL